MRPLLSALLLLGAIPEDLSFTLWFASRGVRVEIVRTPAGPPWLRGTAELPVSAEEASAALRDFDHYREMFSPALKAAAVLDRGADSARLHMVWPYPFPYRNRDAIVEYRAEKLEGGGLLLSWKSDSRSGDPKEGTRIERVAGQTHVEPAGRGRCRLTYTYLGDLGGKFPAWAQEKAWREEPVQYFRAVRRRLGLPDLPRDQPEQPRASPRS